MKTWLITGCSSGFGKVLANAVIARGDRLVATARDPQTLADLDASAPDRVRTATLDVTLAGSAAAALEVAEVEFGGLDVLVNNAGFGFMGAIEEATPDEYRPMFETNLFGLIETTRAALPLLRRRPGGRIVNFSSGAGIAGAAGYGYYNATKFAVEGLSEALAQEVSRLSASGSSSSSLDRSAPSPSAARSRRPPTRSGPMRTLRASSAGTATETTASRPGIRPRARR